VTLQTIGDPADNEVLIRFDPGPEKEGAGEDAEKADLAADILRALRTADESAGGKLDLNVAGEAEIRAAIVAALGSGAAADAERAGAAITRVRNERGGLLPDLAAIRSLPEISPAVGAWIDGSAMVGRFTIRSIDYVGPAVGKDLRTKAQWAVILSLVAMLVYIAFRFHAPAYGVSAVVTLGHDVLVTLGFLSFFQKEFDLTVLAAVLTIVGYSINDTIVIFDRVRDNLRLYRQSDIEKVFNDSINQCLSRTLLTNMLVFMVLLSIWFFGGSRLEPFSFALIVGSISGTYSTIYIAAPIVIWWMRRAERRTARA
jgi:preprotein translocase subunit SecF